jgi:hypothetical protein
VWMEIFDRGMKIVLAEWRCHGENALKHDRDLEDNGVKKVEPSVCAWPKQDIFQPEHLTGMVMNGMTSE